MTTKMVATLLATLAGCGALVTQAPFDWNTPQHADSRESLTLVEVSRERVDGVTSAKYRLDVSGFPAGAPLELWMRPRWPGWQGAALMGSAAVDPQGTVRWQATRPTGAGESSSHGQEVTLSFGKFAAAEGRDWALYDPATGRVAVTRVIPVPVVAKGVGGCRLDLELMAPDGLFFVVSGEGFAPGEVVRIVSRSGDEVVEGTETASASGAFEMGVQPGVIGRESGTASITAAGAQCSVTLNYKWGPEALVHQ